jgi:hypothetical protein
MLRLVSGVTALPVGLYLCGWNGKRGRICSAGQHVIALRKTIVIIEM